MVLTLSSQYSGDAVSTGHMLLQGRVQEGGHALVEEQW